MNDGIEVRLATEADAEALANLNYEFNGVLMRTDEVQESLASSTELVALGVRGGFPVGFACAQYFKSFCYGDGYGEITEMYVREKARRCGGATLIVAFLEAELRARGVRNVKILTGSRNDPAIQTYEKIGYSRDEEVVLSKKLY
ncbi:GNAT family N-acetyltransferase [Paenibacillus sp. HW567]|uniref:GNAT family N-acetyltransferase n=1 Tax=Paenibacillus sp. HW567 TaxID=1034769 RepID=UPI00036922D2|nr:GNAT family N-acetyltransferase [Paenibacillus sp. HW567]